MSKLTIRGKSYFRIKNKIFHLNGKLAYDCWLDKTKSLPNGKGEYYDEKHHIKYVGNFKDGILNGYARVYFVKDNRLWVEGIFKNFKRNDICTVYSLQNKKSSKCTYVDGIKHGYGFVWDITGRLVFKGMWQNGQPIIDESTPLLYSKEQLIMYP